MILAFLLVLPLQGDNSGFGRSLALCGDLDGDGRSEIAVGSPSEGAERRGRVHVFAGQDGSLLRTLESDAPGSGFGCDLAALGDLDGDRIPDLAVGANLLRGPGRGAARDTGVSGQVLLVSGADGKVLRTLAPEAGEQYLGSDLAARGKALLVRARSGTDPKERERLIVFALPSGKRRFFVDGPEGEIAQDLGRPLAFVPDQDGDGEDDLALEAGGTVHLHSGADGKHLRRLAPILLPGERTAFGSSVAGVFGKSPGIVVGDPLAGGSGSLHRFVSRADFEPGALDSDELHPGLGFSLAEAGDLDGDGTQDLVSGWCDGRDGGAWVVSGQDLATIHVLGREVIGEGLPAGWRVAAGADVDGDGKGDFALARFWPTASDRSGGRAVLVFSGKDARRIHELLPPGSAPAPK